MATTCLMSTGRKLPCKDTVGGISTVWFVDFGTLGTATVSNGSITALNGTFVAFKYNLKSASGLEQTITSSNDNGTSYYEQSLTMILTKLDPVFQQELQKIVSARPHVFIKDNNGNCFLVGATRGCDTNGSLSTGIGLGDLNGFSITVTAQEPLLAFFVNEAVITAKESPTQNQP